MENRIAIIGIIVENRSSSSSILNKILSEYGNIIVGRIGVPHKEKNIYVISIIVDGTSDDIGALSGKLGNIKGIKVKVAFTA